MLDREVLWPSMRPASIGPPETKIVGRFRRAAAMSRPGTFLSQLGTMTRASKAWARAMASVLSAIRSRVTREYFMPSCPMAMPSQTAMAGNTTGVPPAIATPIFTASVILSRFMCPGTISFQEDTMPTRGRRISSSVIPRACRRLRWGAFSCPVFILSLFISLTIVTFCQPGSELFPAGTGSVWFCIWQ